METLITPALKDDILNDFISRNMKFRIFVPDESSKFQISDDMYIAIIEQFKNMSLLIIESSSSCGTYFINLTANAHDFFKHGGFKVKEEILEAEINKLGLELEALSKELEPKFLERAQNIATISNAVLSMIFHFK